MAEANLLVRITGTGKDLINEFKKVGNAADESGQQTSSGWSKAKAVFGIAGAAVVGIAVEIGKKSLEMADQYEAAHARLTVALKNTGSSWAAMGKQVDAASMSAVKFGYTKTDIEAALSVMTTGMGSGKKALADLGLAEDIAAARGISLSQAALLVTKASEGQTMALRRAGIDLPIVAGGALKTKTALEALGKAEQAQTVVQQKINAGTLKGPAALAAMQKATAAVTTAQQKFNDTQSSGKQIIEALEAKYKGSAAAAADTFGGKMKALKAAAGDVEISLGMKLIPILTGLATWVTGTVLPAFAKFVGWIEAEWPKLVAYVTPAIDKIKGYIAGFVDTVEHLWLQFGGRIMSYAQETWDHIKSVIQGAVDIIKGVFQLFADILTGKWSKLWGDIELIFTGMWMIIQAEIGQAWDDIKSVVSLAWDGIKNAVSAGAGDVVKFMVGFPGMILNALGDATQWLFNVGVDIIKGLLNGITSMAGGVLGAIKSVLPHSILGVHIPGLAAGGQAIAGMPYVVGEKGPELFIPSSAGTIIPHNQAVGSGRLVGGGGSGTTIVINSYSLDPQSAAPMIVKALQDWSRKNGTVHGVRTSP